MLLEALGKYWGAIWDFPSGFIKDFAFSDPDPSTHTQNPSYFVEENPETLHAVFGIFLHV